MLRASFGVTLVFALTASAAAREKPLAQITTDDVRKCINEASRKKTLNDLEKKTGASLEFAVNGIEYVYVGETPKFTWIYTSSVPLTESQIQEVRAALWLILIDSMTQTGLVSAADGKVLNQKPEYFTLVPLKKTPPPPPPGGSGTGSSGAGGSGSAGTGGGRTVEAVPGKVDYVSVYAYGYYPGWLYGPYGVNVWYSPALAFPAYYFYPTPWYPPVSFWYPSPVYWYPFASYSWYPYMAPWFAPVPWYAPWGPYPYYSSKESTAPASSAHAVRPATEVRPVATKLVEQPAATPVRDVVLREELLKGKTASDWAALYDAGYRAYWAGRYAQAVEYCAAASALSDDPRGWYYLALALGATGDTAGAGEAARFAAACVRLAPEHASAVTDALSRVQGPLRDSLNRLELEVGREDVARRVFAARPTLSRPSATGVASGR